MNRLRLRSAPASSAATPARPRRARRREMPFIVLALICGAGLVSCRVLEASGPGPPPRGAPPVVVFREDSVGPDDVDVTLVVQTSSDRARLLSLFCDRWPGRVAAAVLSPRADDGASVVSELADVAGCGRGEVARIESFRATVGGMTETARLSRGRLSLRALTSRNDSYPINALRNAALELATTSHVLVLDIDFLPSTELYGAILAQRAVLASTERLAAIVPAFSRKGEFKDASMAEWREQLLANRDLAPATLATLAPCLATGRCIQFDATWNPDAHSTTDSARWLEQAAGYLDVAVRAAARSLRTPPVIGRDPPSHLDQTAVPPLRFVRCFESSRYEPYLVLRRSEAPEYDENFVGYGKNKIEYVSRLRYSGFSFAVLPLGFVCHCPHPLSRDKRSWLKEPRGKRAVDRLYKAAVSGMVDNVKKDPAAAAVVNRTWLCKQPRRRKTR